MNSRIARLLCISDTHFGDQLDYRYRERSPVEEFELLRERLLAQRGDCDVLLHLGDLCGDPLRHAESAHYQFVRSHAPFSMELPALYVAGNHDRSAEVLDLLSPGIVALRDSRGDRTDYLYQQKEWQLLALDATVYTKRGGTLRRDQLEWVEAILKSATRRTLVAIHHPPIALGCEWIDSTMLIKEGEALHQILRANREVVAGVLFGHIHDALSVSRDGVHYCSIPSTFFSFATEPQAIDGGLNPSQPTGFAVVDIYPDTTRVAYRLR